MGRMTRETGQNSGGGRTYQSSLKTSFVKASGLQRKPCRGGETNPKKRKKLKADQPDGGEETNRGGKGGVRSNCEKEVSLVARSIDANSGRDTYTKKRRMRNAQRPLGIRAKQKGKQGPQQKHSK